MTNEIMKLADDYADSAKSELRALESCGSNDAAKALTLLKQLETLGMEDC